MIADFLTALASHEPPEVQWLRDVVVPAADEQSDDEGSEA